MYNFMNAVNPDARTELLDGYRRYLLQRDGMVDVRARTLSHREGQMARFEQIEPRHTMDQALFAAHYAKFDAKKPTSKEMLLILTLCKINAAEAYGVEVTFADAEARAKAHDDGIELRVLIEEHYHTRILRSSAREYGIDVSHVFQPPMTLRGLIGSIKSVPVDIARPLVLASELTFVLVFAQTFALAGSVFADKPELRDRIQERIVEILVDELGHVTFNQLQLSAWGMFQARRLFPLVVAGMRNMCREWSPLGMNTTTDLRWLDRLPSEVMERAYVLRDATPVAVAAE